MGVSFISIQFNSRSFHSSCKDRRRLDDLIDRSFMRWSSFRYFSGTRVSAELLLLKGEAVIVVETTDFLFDGDDVDDENNDVPASPVPRRLFFDEVDEDDGGKSSTPVGDKRSKSFFDTPTRRRSPRVDFDGVLMIVSCDR
mmetsp:Transcript_62036/g.151499  ORF Transcript_62036/g.151499 Transcript_62036/m.151499 type:complete len:141 (+) Transcript_62036:41-463(+)